MREVGPFELLEPLGAGGMGEVFKARDRRLNRFVAIKFLPESAPAAARERFQREAQAIAALNHPHICTLYEVGDDQGRPYLVLELLEGETLRARLRRAGALAPEQLLDWGLQIADALDAAHRKGVLHRDLKPDNIWVGPSGHIKVLDFGLARLETPEDAAAPEDKTLTSPGMTLGTIPYMSPEQARGEALDARSDLFSFGSVFYEMATGRAAFARSSSAEILSAILREQPRALAQFRPELSPELDRVANRLLEKDSDLRYQSAADLRSELKRLKRASGSGVAAAVSGDAIAPAKHGSGWRWLAIAAAIVIVGAALAWWRLAPRAPAPPPALQFQQLTFSGHVQDAVISPDGKFLAHVDAGPQGTSLHLLSIGSGSDVQIAPPGAGCCQSPAFSPDGNSVYFLLGDTLTSVPVLGGAARTIASQVCSGAGFSPDGMRIAYIGPDAAEGTTLMLAHADGSQSRVLSRPPAGLGYDSPLCWVENYEPNAPAWSPNGKRIAVFQSSETPIGRIQIIQAAGGGSEAVGPTMRLGASGLAWLPDGRGLLVTASVSVGAAPELWSIAIPGSAATKLTDDLQGYTHLSVAADGAVALIHAAPQYSIWTQAAVDGAFHELPGGGATQDGAGGLAWTPQGQLVVIRDLNGHHQVWEEASDGANVRALQAADDLEDPVVAPDGQIVLDSDFHALLWRMNADGSEPVQLVHLAPGAAGGEPAMIDGGKAVAFLQLDAHGVQNLWAVPLAGGAARRISSLTVSLQGNPASPDGTRIFALSQESGATDTHGPVIVPLDGATTQATPVGMDYKTMRPPYGWTPDGRAITYVVNQGSTDNIWAFPLNGGNPYALTHFTDLRIAAYAFSRDGRLAVSRGTPNSDAVLATGLVPGGRQ